MCRLPDSFTHTGVIVFIQLKCSAFHTIMPYSKNCDDIFAPAVYAPAVRIANPGLNLRSRFELNAQCQKPIYRGTRRPVVIASRIHFESLALAAARNSVLFCLQLAAIMVLLIRVMAEILGLCMVVPPRQKRAVLNVLPTDCCITCQSISLA